MILRAATAADRDPVTQLALSFHGSSPYSQLLTVDPVRVGTNFDLALAQGVVLVAEVEHGDEGELAGFVCLVALEHMLSGDRYAEEVAWWVEPRYRSGTVGPHLLALAERWAQLNGCVFLKMVAPDGSAVGRYYARRGYQPIETAWLKRLVA